MKISLILLICVVATFALPERIGNDENLNEKRRHYRGGRQNYNQISGNADDETSNDSISSNEPTTEKSRCNWIRRENRRHWQKIGDREEWGRRNSSDLNDEDLRGQFPSTNESDENQDSLLTDGVSEIERRHHKHHRHHRHHHHHHHKNRTTTTTTTTTTTLSTPLSGMEE